MMKIVGIYLVVGKSRRIGLGLYKLYFLIGNILFGNKVLYILFFFNLSDVIVVLN